MEDLILKDILQVVLDNKGIDVCYLDCVSINPLANYYVITTVSSNRQALALAKYVSDVLDKHDIKVNHIEGNSTSEWVLVDGIDYIIHIFVNEAREHYGLEKMWSNQTIIKVG